MTVSATDSLLLVLHLRIFAAEPVHTTGGVDQLLTTREERVAVGANFHTDRLARRARRIRRPAGTNDGDLFVIRMDASFHVNNLYT